MSILNDSHCVEPMVSGATHGTMVAQQLLRRGDVDAAYNVLHERPSYESSTARAMMMRRIEEGALH